MKNKNCLYTLVIGKKAMYPYAIQNHREYAERIGVDHIVQTEYKSVIEDNFTSPKLPLESSHPAYYEKICQIIELSKQYERVLFLDADIFIRPNSPSIFEEYPDPNSDQFFGVPEYMSPEKAMGRIVSGIPKGQKLTQPFKMVTAGKSLQFPLYINAGMFLIGQKHPLLHLIKKEDLITVSHQTREIEQAYPSYLISEHNLDFTPIGGQWNFFQGEHDKISQFNYNHIVSSIGETPSKELYNARNNAYFTHCIGWGPYKYLWEEHYKEPLSLKAQIFFIKKRVRADLRLRRRLKRIFIQLFLVAFLIHLILGHLL